MFANACSQRVQINEVGTRDGFQSEPLFVPTDSKIHLLNALSKVGLNKIEVTSFVSPRAIPNLRDAEEVMNSMTRHPDVTYVTLVPNEKGAERALACRSDEINLVMSVSQSHNLANMRMTREQSLAQFARIVALLDQAPMKINGTLATAFGCPFEGLTPIDNVVTYAARYLETGIQTLTIADTTGMASPGQVYEVCRALRDQFPTVTLTLHLHNTRGMGLANVLAGLEAGVTAFDASLGGIGGCPYAPGATGNICTEDLVHMLDSSGIETGVKLDELLKLARSLPELLEHDVPGQLIKAGLRTETRPVSESVRELLAQHESK